MDGDLARLAPDELLAEARRLRAAIRAHRDTSGHDLCWHHPAMWDLLPDKQPPTIEVPEWPQFMRGCVRYRASLDEQAPSARRVPRELEP